MGWMHTQNGVEYNCSLVDTDKFQAGEAESQKMIAWASNNKYARWTVYYVVVVIFLVMVRRIADNVIDSRYRAGKNAPVAGVNKLIAIGRSIGYRRLPPLIHHLTCLPSSVGACLMLGAGFLYMLLICFIPHFYFRECFNFGSPPLAVRAGMMSNALTPFIYAFSGKTNIISGLTGVSYEKLQVYHAGLAWLSVFFAWVHTIPFLFLPVWEGGYGWLHEMYITNAQDISGTVAIVALTILSLFSLKSFRDRFYELFLHLHWPTAIAYLGLLFWHDANSLESWMYLWGALAAYGAGLCYRYLQKTSYMQLHRSWFQTEEASLRVLDDNAVEVTVYTSAIRPWRPSQHLFIRFTSIQPLGSHPFTIASLPEVATDRDGSPLKVRLITKAYSGFTRMLYDVAQQKSETSYRVLLDGPYGGIDRDVCAFDDVVLCCSGSGGTAIFPLLTYLARVSAQSQIRVKRIRLLWSIRHAGAYEWFRDEIDEAIEVLKGKVDIEVVVHVSQDHAPTHSTHEVQGSQGSAPESVERLLAADEKEVAESSGPVDSPSPLSRSPLSRSPSALGVVFNTGRASIPNQLNAWADSFGDKAIVITAGCEGVRYDVCQTVANLQMRVLTGKQQEIFLHTESFGW